MSAEAVLAAPARALGEHLAANDITMTFTSCAGLTHRGRAPRATHNLKVGSYRDGT